ncbi:MAG: electron transfer flavoprotein subunit alpha/FixB family protein [Myxococcales bacterium]|nr:electron transfer flavoprotein subunit alpha/FixB family protein [Myxococcales bacterium]
MTDVLVVAELMDGTLRRNTLAAVTLAKQVAEGTGGAFDILAIGEGSKAAADEAAKYGARKVLAAEIAGGYFAEAYAPTVADISKAGGYGVITATASTYGKDLMPRVAARIGAANISDIRGVSVEGGTPNYVRPMYAGNVFGTVTSNAAVTVVTARQSEFDPAAEAGSASPVEEAAVSTDAVAGRVEFVSLESQKSERPDLAEASIVVSGGRALKSDENFKNVLEPLVDAMGAAMGASRAAVDAGYVPGDLQVGQTGKVVAPNLYVAVGISGAIQHLAGMKGSKLIVAINKDKEAPIAQVADYFLVADLFQAVPEMTEKVKAVKG